MRKKKKVFIFAIGLMLLFLIIGFVLAVLLADENVAPSKEQQKGLVEECVWTMEYDDDNNLVLAESWFPGREEPSQGLYYKYDEKGNRIEREISDYFYQEGGEATCYKYKKGKLDAKWDLHSDVKYVYDYKFGTVIASTIEGEIKCKYELNLKGQVTAILDYDSNGNEHVDTECEYDFWGRLTKLRKVYYDVRHIYKYQYDSLGRRSKIIFREATLGNYPDVFAEYVYQNKSKDYDVYAYNGDDELVYKYSYEHDDNGNLVKVIICANENVEDVYKYRWGTIDIHFDDNYPSGEIPDNFYESW